MAWPAAAALLGPVVDAVASVHAAGWVHGDVAAANVVVTDAGAVLVDLGWARPVGDARATGTPGTVAPEVVAGRPVTPAAEVWSLATLATALLSGDRSAPVPAEAAIALRRALAEDPGARPTAAQLAATLRLAAGVGEHGDPRTATTVDYGPRPPAPPRPSAPPARRWGAILAVPAAVAALAVVARLSGDDPAIVGASTARTPSCPIAPAGAGLVADPDGDGCDVAATWSGGVLTIALRPGSPPTRVAVGAPGDDVVLGDWDCDGVDTPGAYRPTTGVVTLWDDWPTPDRPTGVAPVVVRTDPAGGSAAVDGDAAGCDHLIVTPPGSVPPDG
jgi:hypothetical protein